MPFKARGLGRLPHRGRERDSGPFERCVHKPVRLLGLGLGRVGHPKQCLLSIAYDAKRIVASHVPEPAIRVVHCSLVALA